MLFKDKHLRTDRAGWSERKRALLATLMTGLMVALVAPTPVVATDEEITGTVTDDQDNPLVGTTVTVTNQGTGAWATTTTNGNGVYTMAPATIGVSSGNTILVTVQLSISLNGCTVPFLNGLTVQWFQGRMVNLRGILLPAGGAAGTTLDLGAAKADRTAAGAISFTNGLGFHRVQGDANPWGKFQAEADFQLTDNMNLAAPSDRWYQFRLTVKYLGYYDANCAWNAVGGIGNDANQNAQSTYTNNVPGLPYDSTLTTVTFPLGGGGALPLDAAKVGQANNDKLMKIEIEARIYECDGVVLWNNCNGGGPLDFTAKKVAYVEP